jgi:hypothetical protein
MMSEALGAAEQYRGRRRIGCAPAHPTATGLALGTSFFSDQERTMDCDTRILRRTLLFGGVVVATLPVVARARSAAVLAALAAPAATPAHVAPRAELAYEALVTLTAEIPHGRTPFGERIRVPITGGWFRGAAIAGQILPGGADWQPLRADGYFALDADYFMAADDGTPIDVRNRGLWHSPNNDWPADYAVTTPE